MDYNTINWDNIPDIISKEQFYQLCHISKATAKYLLESKKVPCEIFHKSTHRYKIKKVDVIEFLRNRTVNPEYYMKPSNCINRRYSSRAQIPADTDMTEFYSVMLESYPDVMTAKYISQVTGYQQSTVNGWHQKGHVKGFIKSRELHIPKIYLIEFFNSQYFRNIPQKNFWHKNIEKEFIKTII